MTDGAAEVETPRAAVKTLATVSRRVGDFTWRGLLAGAAFSAFAAAVSRGSSDALPLWVVPLYGGSEPGRGRFWG